MVVSDGALGTARVVAVSGDTVEIACRIDGEALARVGGNLAALRRRHRPALSPAGTIRGNRSANFHG